MSIKLKTSLPNLQRESVEELLRKIKTLDPEKPYRVFFSDKRNIRTKNQNAYYWGVIIKEMSNHFGMDSLVCHCILKDRFLKTTITHKDMIYEYTGDTKSLNTKEFTDYIDQVRIWLSNEHEVYTPDPNELTDEEYIQYLSS